MIAEKPLDPLAQTKSSRWLALVVLCTGMLMIVLDQTIVNVPLPLSRSLPLSRCPPLPSAALPLPSCPAALLSLRRNGRFALAPAIAL